MLSVTSLAFGQRIRILNKGPYSIISEFPNWYMKIRFVFFTWTALLIFPWEYNYVYIGQIIIMKDMSCFAVRLKAEEEAISLPILSNHMLTLDQYISDIPHKVLYSQRWTLRAYCVKYRFFLFTH